MNELKIIPSEKIKDEREVDEGAFGVVCVARHVDWGQVSLKRISGARLKPTQVKKLRDEAEKLSQLKHPNIIQVLGFMQDANNCAIVLEYSNCHTLSDFVDVDSGHNVAINLKIQLLYDVALGMNYLHTQTPPIIHRDLKALNVFICDGYTAKLGEFGLCEWKTIVRNVSAGSVPRGTLTHVPPEKWRDINFHMTTKCDVYSFAVLIWEVLMGTYPFKDVDEMQIKVSILEGQRPSVADLPADTPPSAIQLMQQCWDQEPDNRPTFSYIREFMEEEFIHRDNFTQAVEKDKLQLKQHMNNEYESNGNENGHSVPPSQLDEAYGRLSLQPNGALDIGYTESVSAVVQPASQQIDILPVRSVSVVGTVPTTVIDTGSVTGNSMQRMYNIVPLETDVVSDSIPFFRSDPPELNKAELNESVADKRRMSAPAMSNKFTAPGGPSKAGTSKEFKKQKQSHGPTIIQKGKPGETMVVTTSKIDGLQIGDRNVMYIGGQGPVTRGHFKPNPRTAPDHRKEIIKGKLLFEKSPIDEESMQLLAEHLGKYWKLLARKLGFSDGQIDSLNSDYHTDGQREMIYQMLRQWKGREGRSATIYVIGNALIDIGRPGTASMLSKHSATHKCSNTKI